MKQFVRVLAMVVAVAAGGAVASAQQPKKVHRIGYLSPGDSASNSTRIEGVRLALRALGHVEGQNVATEYRYAEGKPGRLPELAAELVRLKVDVIVVSGGDLPIRAAMNATKTIPIVMVGLGIDPVKAGFIESLAHPGGNVTGLTLLSRELGAKRLELLKEAVPKIARVAVLYNATIPSVVRDTKEVLPVAARALGLTIQLWEVRDANGFDKVFAAMGKQRSDGLYVPLAGAVLRPKSKWIAGYALKSRLPSVWDNRRGVEDGGLMSYATDAADNYWRLAAYVDKILKGAKPGDLPVERPTKFELIINLKAAKAIGVNISQSLLYRADRVIK